MDIPDSLSDSDISDETPPRALGQYSQVYPAAGGHAARGGRSGGSGGRLRDGLRGLMADDDDDDDDLDAILEHDARPRRGR